MLSNLPKVTEMESKSTQSDFNYCKTKQTEKKFT